MRIARIMSLSGIGLLLAAQAVLAQDATNAPGSFTGPGHFPMGGGGRLGFAARVVTGQPYSGVRTTTFVQTLAEGGTINRTTTTKEARDSSGRVYRETQFKDENGARTVYAVFDPVNHVATNWRSDSKQAVVRQLPNRGGHRQLRVGTETTDDQQAGASFHRHGPAPTVEQLGTKTIEGVDATGTRSTVTFPAGAMGNSQPIAVTHERWVSSDLGITVLEIDSDPRNGVRTTALSNIQRSEPDAALFQAPKGYAITERTRGQRF